MRAVHEPGVLSGPHRKLASLCSLVPEWLAGASDEIGSLDVKRQLTVEELERWLVFGATWRLVEISDCRAVVDLCQCTGELVERRGASDPMVVEYLRSHPLADA